MFQDNTTHQSRNEWSFLAQNLIFSRGCRAAETVSNTVCLCSWVPGVWLRWEEGVAGGKESRKQEKSWFPEPSGNDSKRSVSCLVSIPWCLQRIHNAHQQHDGTVGLRAELSSYSWYAGEMQSGLWEPWGITLAPQSQATLMVASVFWGLHTCFLMTFSIASICLSLWTLTQAVWHFSGQFEGRMRHIF